VNQPKLKYSRRDFARKAAILTASVPLLQPAAMPSGAPTDRRDDQQPQNLPANFPKLSDQSRAEVEARYEAILKQYVGRFNEQQKTELRRLSFLAQPALDKLRAYTVQNGDSPALYLKPIVEREKKPAKSVSATAAAATKKP